jgi:hypothetical protein
MATRVRAYTDDEIKTDSLSRDESRYSFSLGALRQSESGWLTRHVPRPQSRCGTCRGRSAACTLNVRTPGDLHRPMASFPGAHVLRALSWAPEPLPLAVCASQTRSLGSRCSDDLRGL